MINFKFLILFTIYIDISLEYSQITFVKDDKILKLNSPCVTSEGESGKCERVCDCPEERFKLDRRDICYFERNNPVVCCKDVKLGPIYVTVPPSQQVNFAEIIANALKNSTNETTVVEDPSPEDEDEDEELPLADQIYNDRVRNSVRLPNQYCKQTPFLKEPSENDTSNILFTGGNLSKPLENPQMAAIGWRNTAGDDNIDWKCGGSLISHNFIITAAHCTSDRGQSPEVVRVGDLNLLKKDDINSQDFIITDIFVHPQYHRQLLYHDIALIKISPNASFNDFVKPACLWIEKDVPLQQLIAMGYGTNAFAGKKTNELYEGNLEHVTNDNCREAFGTDIKIPNGIIDNQVCAKDPKGIADTCQGDSGGPLIFRSGSGYGIRQHLIGITSFGESCAGPTPGVYTRVSSYIDWIEPIVWPSGDF